MLHPIAAYLDFANHAANATPGDIEKLCADVITYGFHAAFMNTCYISLARSHLAKLKIGTVISFPLGQDTVAAKVAAVNEAVQLGADELDIVPNSGLFTFDELQALVDSARMPGKPVIVKFILDPGYCTPDELSTRAKLIQRSGADYIKIGSGMGPRNPTLEDVHIVREAVPEMKIKVAGGITTYKIANMFIDAGVTRIGTSHAKEIIAQS